MLTKLVLVTALTLLLTATPAAADGWWGEVTCHKGEPNCEVAAGVSAGSAPAPHRPALNGGTQSDGTPAHTPPCVPSIPPGLTDPADQDAWRQFACATPGSASGSFGTQGLAVSPSDLALVARNRLRLLIPVVASNPGGMQLVHLPTWLWLATGWEPVSATASVPGLSVTATATPTSASWSMGDGTTVVCAKAGTPYRPGYDPKAPSPDCGHTYRTSSASQPEQAFPVKATVRWTVTWSGTGDGGPLPDMTTTGDAAFRVAESQALNHGG